jgi:hypothetical protein
MNMRLLSVTFLFAAAIAGHPAAHAAGDATVAIEQMANIILKLDAKPGKDAKLTLDDIANDTGSTYNERILATSIKNIDKKIRSDDKPPVLKVMTSPAASESERQMAKVLLRFNEKPSDRAKQVLSQLID